MNEMNIGIKEIQFENLARTHNTGFVSGGVVCKLGALYFYSSSV